MFKKSAAPAAAGGYTISKSLRFRSSASAYLNRTPASSSNQKTWTFSAWIKRGLLNTDTTILGTSDSGSYNNNVFTLRFLSGAGIRVIQIDNSGSQLIWFDTNAVYRDPSAWYHIVLAIDTTQATNTNGVKLYVNGVLQSGTFSAYTQNTNTSINSSSWSEYLGRYGSVSPTSYFDGYMAEINFVDGQQLTPTSFGSTNSTTGVWQPAAYTGSYGTNGFYLKFTDTSSTAALGTDYSGNSNTWTVNNFSLTAGATYDSMTDVPTLTSATTANYCVLNPLQTTQPVTISNANLTVSCGNGSAYGNIWGSMAIPSSGKYYFEVTPTSNAAQATFGLQSIPGSGTTRVEWYSGTVYYNGTSASAGTYTNNDVCALAIDVTGGFVYLYVNNVLQTTLTYNIAALTLFPYFGTGYSNTIVSYNVNFGQQGFKYTPPSGYVALNTYNLPTSTIVQGNQYMDATTYSGAGNTPTSITNQYGFKPDLVWTKARSTTYNNILYDSVRGTGTTKSLYSDDTAAEGAYSTYTNLSSFNSNGWTIGTTAGNNAMNASGQTFVGWQWQAGQGSSSSNTNGSITSTVSASTTAGFSIVTYTGTGSSPKTIGHGLGIAPSFIIIKDRSVSSQWIIQHASLGWTQGFFGFNTNAATSSTAYSNNTAPTSNVFTIDAYSNNSSENYVAYCWTPIAGFSAFGSYTGNGSTSGPFIYLGFQPKFILIKCSSAAGLDWAMFDSARSPYNSVNNMLFADTNQSEFSGSSYNINFLSNGFQIGSTSGQVNTNGNTYVYAAFAENPFKNSLAF
jgi:hypothetical protein